MNLGLAYYGRTGVECNRGGLDEWGYCGRTETGCKHVGLARGGFDVHEWKIRDMVMVGEASGCMRSWAAAKY